LRTSGRRSAKSTLERGRFEANLLKENALAGLTVTRADGSTATIGREALDQLATSLEGSLLEPGGESYDEVRAIWNAMIDRKPGLIVRCSTAGDVAAAVNFARSRKIMN
jgi:hypothetical protein